MSTLTDLCLALVVACVFGAGSGFAVVAGLALFLRLAEREPRARR